MNKIPILMREPRMGDYNRIANTINEIIDKIEKKAEVINLQITKYVKDFSFFKKEDSVEFPYHRELTITNLDDYNKLIEEYNIDREMVVAFKNIIEEGNVISLGITIDEDVTEKDKKQEIAIKILDSVTVEELEEEIKVEAKKNKKTKRKTNGWNKIKKKK